MKLGSPAAILALVVSWPVSSGTALAQNYPTKPIRIIAPPRRAQDPTSCRG